MSNDPPAGGPPHEAAPMPVERGASPEAETTPRRTSELDEFLARAVDRQIAEQRALRETLNELAEAVRELQARPAATLDLDELDERIKRHVGRTSESVGDDLRTSVGSVSADVEGIAQALIELNAGLRDWADGMDENLASVLRTVDHVREVAADLQAQQARVVEALRTSNAQTQQLYNQLIEATHASAAQVQELNRQAMDASRSSAAHAQQLHGEVLEATRASAEYTRELHTEVMNAFRVAEQRAEEDRLRHEEWLRQEEDRLAQPAGAAEDMMMVPADSPLAAAPLVELPQVSEFAHDIEQQVKESIELSLYLADQIEDFDRVIAKMGDLPTRLEGVVSQALKRTLAARSKLDREAEIALDDVLNVLDEHVERIGRVTDDRDAITSISDAQTELSSRVEALHADLLDRVEILARAIDAVSAGERPRAAAALGKSRPRGKSKAKTKPKARKRSTRRTQTNATDEASAD